ncbi:DUF4352 domain-containing protein [Ornithinimicrobium ciconiae]|nr:DUF4352 domain-containing protein [Ornithinimicrobium ciconiae]
MRASLLAVAATSVLVLSACGSQAPEVVTPDARAEAATDGETSDSTATVEVEEVSDEETTGAEAEGDAPEDEPEDEEAPEEVSGELGLGDTAQVGDYKVAVTEVLLDANDVVQQANEFNDDPEGQYVLVSMEVTYTGDDEGNPWLDLNVELAGSDARIYDSSSCWAVTPNSLMDVPTLTTGGTADFDVCFDVPVEALEDPRVRVEESFSFSDTRVIWDPSREGTQTEDPEDDTPPPAAGGADALPLGTEAEVGDYTVAVSDVLLDANDVVQQANEFNDDPEGQYVLVSMEVTYTGDDEGDPWLDLNVELAGSDARIYDSSSCWGVTPNSVMDVPTLTTGGTADFDVCFDVPVEALDAPRIRVDDFLSFNSDSRTVWESQK